MITIKPKTRSKIEIKTLEEVIPFLSKFSKNWKRLTPLVKQRLIQLLVSNTFYPNMYHFGLVIRKDILGMRSGTFKSEEYRDIFGWSEEEISKLFNSKAQIFKNCCAFTPGQKEFWIKHHHYSEADAIKKVSETQRKLSKRKKKTTINQPTSLAYYIHRGMSEEQGLKEQSAGQKKRRSNCIEYWLNKGYSKEDAQKEISELQKKRSMFSIEYWLHRGYTLEEAQKHSGTALKNQSTGRISKISQKFFKEVILSLEHDGFSELDFKYGENEHIEFISPKRRIYLDFLHVPSKKVIEFDGKYWHNKRQEQDSNRDDILKSMDYTVLRIPETYNKALWNKYIIQAVEFIKEN